MTGGLFLDSLTEREKRVDRLMAHFRHAEYLHSLRRSSEQQTPLALLWILLEEAMHTARNVPDAERRAVSRVGTVMPATRVTVDEAYKVELSRLLDGMSQYDATQVQYRPSASAVDRMVDVLDLLRFVRAANSEDRDRLKRTVLARAAGLSLEQCTRVWDRHRVEVLSRQAMHDIKQRVLGQVLAGIEAAFGLKRTSRSFRRLTIRELERQARARKREAERLRREAEADAVG